MEIRFDLWSRVFFLFRLWQRDYARDRRVWVAWRWTLFCAGGEFEIGREKFWDVSKGPAQVTVSITFPYGHAILSNAFERKFIKIGEMQVVQPVWVAQATWRKHTWRQGG